MTILHKKKIKTKAPILLRNVVYSSHQNNNKNNKTQIRKNMRVCCLTMVALLHLSDGTATVYVCTMSNEQLWFSITSMYIKKYCGKVVGFWGSPYLNSLQCVLSETGARQRSILMNYGSAGRDPASCKTFSCHKVSGNVTKYKYFWRGDTKSLHLQNCHPDLCNLCPSQENPEENNNNKKEWNKNLKKQQQRRWREWNFNTFVYRSKKTARGWAGRKKKRESLETSVTGGKRWRRCGDATNKRSLASFLHPDDSALTPSVHQVQILTSIFTILPLIKL